ncbi:hypothetical protein Q9L58_001273 [Maublancomyces gigas]|uniref:Uncharacterized protein n=1 Tax=Discina gigas TaxID=1032678 RepID=A0ABR3GUU4_9PEZI
MTSAPPYKILTTPPPRRSFPLPTSPESYFTGDLFDRLVLFLHKHCVTFTSIECVARGVDKAAALRDGPTLCVYVVQDDSVTRKPAQKKKEGYRRVKWNKGEERKELVVVKDGEADGGTHNGVGKGEETSDQEERSEGARGRNRQGEQHPGKQQTEELDHYVKEVARLFKKCQFAHEVPPEICFVEFVGVIIHEEPGRNTGTTGAWANGGVVGILRGS